MTNDRVTMLRVTTLRFLLGSALLAASTAAPATAAGEAESFDAVGHTLDGNYLDFSPFAIVELPRLFLVREADGGLGFEFFSSTEAALRSGRYAMVGGHGEAHGDGEVHAEDDLHGEAAEVDGGAHGAAEFGAGEPSASELTVMQEVFDQHEYLHAGMARTEGEVLVDFSITRHLLFALLAIVILCVLFIPMASKYKQGIGRTEAPRGTKQNLLEVLVLYIRDEVARPNLGDKADKYLPYLLTIFFFILTCNLLGLVPFGATATANITTTAVLALFTFFVTQFAGTKDYWMHIFNPPGIPWFVKPIMVPIEFLGLFIKPFALAIRLFANMLAGHLVILNLIGLIFAIRLLFGDAAGWGTSVPSFALTVFIYGLEVLVAFIQAYVFTILSALFIGMATAEHEHHGHEHEPHSAHDLAVAASAPLVHGNGYPLSERTVGTEAVI